MGKNHNSVVVLRIRPKFWWMLPMGVRNNHTKYESEAQRWQPGTGVARARPRFQKLQFRAKISLFLPKTSLECTKNGRKKENSGYLTLKPDRVVRSRGRSGMGSNIAWHRRHNDSVD